MDATNSGITEKIQRSGKVRKEWCFSKQKVRKSQETKYKHVLKKSLSSLKNAYSNVIFKKKSFANFLFFMV